MLKKLNALAKNLEAEREGLKASLSKVDTIEGRMQSLQHLSELISVRYNPFLEDSEGALSDGRRASDLLPNRRNAPNHVPHSPLAEIVPLAPPPAAPTTEDAALDVPSYVEPAVPSHVPARQELPLAPPTPTVQAPPAQKPAPARNHPAPHPVRSVPAISYRQAGPQPVSHHAFPPNVQNPREAFLILEWFEYLIKRLPAREIPKLIDYYHEIAWIDPSLHAWLLAMAEGIAGPRTPEGDAAFRKEAPRRLVKIHKATLRFLDLLHEPTLAHGQSQGLERRTRAAFRDR